MSASSASIHPVEETPATDVGDVAPIVSMKNIEGMPGTRGGLALRCFQLGFASAAFGIMAASSDFASVSAFSYLVAAAGLQGLWSFFLAVIDIYALLVKRNLHNRPIVTFFAVGDGSLQKNLEGKPEWEHLKRTISTSGELGLLESAKNLEEKPERENLKKTISASDGLGLLQSAKNLEGKPERENLKRTISITGGFRLLESAKNLEGKLERENLTRTLSTSGELGLLQSAKNLEGKPERENLKTISASGGLEQLKIVKTKLLITNVAKYLRTVVF